MTVVEREVVEALAVPVYPELLEAAERIRREGWWQCGNPWEGPELGGYCLITSIPDTPGPQCRAAISAALGGPLASWNDTPGRTKQEVIDLLERVGWLG